MPNDAKLGLVLGVALVLIIAVVFFRKDAVGAQPPRPSAQEARKSIRTPPPPAPKASEPQPLPPPVLPGVEDLPLPPPPVVE